MPHPMDRDNKISTIELGLKGRGLHSKGSSGNSLVWDTAAPCFDMEQLAPIKWAGKNRLAVR